MKLFCLTLITALTLATQSQAANFRTLTCESDADWSQQLTVFVVGNRVISASLSTVGSADSVNLTQKELRALRFLPPNQLTWGGFNTYTCKSH